MSLETTTATRSGDASDSEAKAVLYLRVSSKRQMDTAIDIDPDGNSIATQREVSMRKANNLGATVVQEFVEPGVSASTIEKRQAFQDMLTFLRENPDVRYVIVGRIGWNTLALQRRLREHPEFGRRLFWLDDASDADLHYLYPLACALVFPSFVEGFGLPLVEAAHFGARVIASDIPVFREVGGDAVAYFDTLDSASLAKRVREALAAPKLQRALPVLSWRQSAEALFALLDGAPSPHAGWLD